MRTIIKFILLDLLRNKTLIVYAIILAVVAISVLNMDSNNSKGILSILSITQLFVPVISILFSTIYFFNIVEFTELVLAQPVRRNRVLFAEYLGIAFALCIAYSGGVGLPLFILSSGTASFTLWLSGIFLTLIFSAIALLIFVMVKDKTKGIGAAIITALFFTILFDGLLLSFIYSFNDYPIDKPLIALIALNPVDLGRIFVILQLDVAVMMGYSGALFKMFLGSSTGSIFTLSCMLLWVVIPLLLALRRFKRKDL